MNQCTRRSFTLYLAGAAAANAALTSQADGAPERVTEEDPYARSMGFRTDTARVDQAKYPRHDVNQHCSECQLFSGKPGEDLGPCSFYGGRLVPPTGWCRNFKQRKAKV